MQSVKKAWLRIEQFIILNKPVFWLALYVFFFFVFPFLVTEPVDFDAISSTIPETPPE